MKNSQHALPPEQQTEQLHSVLPTASHSPSKTFIILTAILLIAAIVAVGVGGYFLGANQNQVIQNQPQPTPIAQPSPTPNPTVNWKTYTNTKFGFVFKYPIEWPDAKEENISSNSGLLYQQISFGEAFIVHARDERHNSPYILEEYANQAGASTNVTTKDVSTQNFKAFKLIKSNGDVTIHISESLKSVKIIRLIYNKNSLQDIYADQILATFKFTDQVSPTQISPEGKFCGGFAANLPENQCPTGYTCKLDSNYPDAGGKCVKNK